MVNVTQILLPLVIAALTVMLVVIGIQLVKILQEFRLVLQKMNRILDDTANVTHSVAQPIVGLADFLDNVKSGVSLLSHLKQALTQTETRSELPLHPNGEKDDLGYIEDLQEKGRHSMPQFFHKQGKSLG